MATAEALNPGYRLVTNDTGRVFRVGETSKQLLGYPRGLVIMAAWLCMCLAGLLEYTWAALSPSLAPAHHWGDRPDILAVFLLRHLRVVRADRHGLPA
jgi:hypothetical protein